MTRYAVIEKAMAKWDCGAVLFNTKKDAIFFCKKQSKFNKREFIVVSFGMGEFVTSYKDGKKVE